MVMVDMKRPVTAGYVGAADSAASILPGQESFELLDAQSMLPAKSASPGLFQRLWSVRVVLPLSVMAESASRLQALVFAAPIRKVNSIRRFDLTAITATFQGVQMAGPTHSNHARK